jgi:hypothetical protein
MSDHRSPDEREEMARLLPALVDRNIPGRRHQILKDYLMLEMDRQHHTAPTPNRARRPRRRLSLIALPLATAGVIAASYALAVSGGPHQPTESTAIDSGAVQLLNRVATVAYNKPELTVRGDQYIYVKSFGAALVTNGDAPAGHQSFLPKPRSREAWLSVDGTRNGLLVESGSREMLDADPRPGLNDPTYRYLESLPTDPDVLLRKIYTDTKGAGPGPNEEAFTTIGDALREQLVPPKISAALYKAAAKIPGVITVNDAVDGIGRHGIAVAFNGANGERTEWIFNAKTLDFLGEASVQTKNTSWAKAGQVIVNSAVINRAIVDRPGQTPTS